MGMACIGVDPPYIDPETCTETYADEEAERACRHKSRLECQSSPECRWGPSLRPTRCMPPHVRLRNGCGLVTSGEPCFGHGDTIRALARGVQNVRTGRVAPVYGPLVGCCPSLGEEGCETDESVCTWTTPNRVHMSGCGMDEMCALVVKDVQDDGVVDLYKCTQPPLLMRCVNVGEIPGSKVVMYRSSHDILLELRGDGNEPPLTADPGFSSLEREGWYVGELLRTHRTHYGDIEAEGLVLLQATSEVIVMPLYSLFTIDAPWAAGAGHVLLGNRPLTLGARVRARGSLGLVIAFEARAGIGMEPICPSAVTKAHVCTDEGEIFEVPLSAIEFAHPPSLEDWLKVGSTALLYSPEDAALRYPNTVTDVPLLLHNLETTPDAWFDVMDTADPDAPVNSAFTSRLVNARDMHPHMCILDDSTQQTKLRDTESKRTAIRDRVRASLPPEYELRWEASKCLQARFRPTTSTECTPHARACCLKATRMRKRCENLAEGKRCEWPCQKSGDKCTFRLPSVTGVACGGVSDELCARCALSCSDRERIRSPVCDSPPLNILSPQQLREMDTQIKDYCDGATRIEHLLGIEGVDARCGPPMWEAGRPTEGSAEAFYSNTYGDPSEDASGVGAEGEEEQVWWVWARRLEERAIPLLLVTLAGLALGSIVKPARLPVLIGTLALVVAVALLGW